MPSSLKSKGNTSAKLMMMFAIVLSGIWFFLVPTVHAQAPADVPPQPTSEYRSATVIQVQEEKTIPWENQTGYLQTVQVQDDQGQVSTVQMGSEYQPLAPDQRLAPGQKLVLQVTAGTADIPESLGVSDRYRLPLISGLLFLFVGAVAVVGGWPGIKAIMGLGVSIGVLVGTLLPALMAGFDPLLVSLAVAFFMGTISVYMTHGWSFQSHVSWISLSLSLLIVALLAYGSVHSFQLSGRGSEEALFLQTTPGVAFQLPGLLLGGIILGALGVLDDIIVSQVAVVTELYAAKPKIEFAELFGRALRVGRTHVASLVNTLVLAYAGANLPLFLLFHTSQQPLWVTLNSEIIMEEMVRTLTGSIGLIVAVPISTAIAAGGLLFLPRMLEEKMLKNQGESHAGHRH